MKSSKNKPTIHEIVLQTNENIPSVAHFRLAFLFLWFDSELAHLL